MYIGLGSPINIIFSSIEALIQVHFAVTCIQPLNTFFSDCVLLVISKRVWAYTPATSWYTRHSPQPIGYDPRIAQTRRVRRFNIATPNWLASAQQGRTGLHSRSRNLLLLPLGSFFIVERRTSIFGTCFVET